MMTKIENQLNRFAFKLDYNKDSADQQPVQSEQPNNLPNVNVLKRRELFEKDASLTEKTVVSQRVVDEFGPTTKSLSIKERLSNLEKHVDDTKEDILLTKLNRLAGDFNSVKEIRTNIEHPIDEPPVIGVKQSTVKIDVPVVPLKDRLTSLHSGGVPKISDEINDDDSPIVTAVKDKISAMTSASSDRQLVTIVDCIPRNVIDADRDDSGIHTADVSCCVSQADEPLLDEDVSTVAQTVQHVEHVDDDKQLNGTTADDNNNDDDDDEPNESEQQPLEENDKTESVTDDLSTIICQTTIDEPLTSADDIVDQIADIAADDKSTNEQDTSVSLSESFVFDLIDTVEGKLVVDFKNENSIKSISNDGCGTAIDVVATTTTAIDKQPSVTNHNTLLSSASSTPSVSVMVVNQLDNYYDTSSNVNSKLDSILTSTIDTDNNSTSNSTIHSNHVNNDNCNSSSSSSSESVVTNPPAAIEEVTCKKIDTRTVRDPTHIPTPCISVGRGRQKKSLTTHDKYGTNDTVFESVEDLLKAESTIIENSAAKNERIKCQIVGVLEKTRTPSNLLNPTDEKPVQAPPLSPSKCSNLLTGKSIKPISPSKSTTVNIFDFIKRNLLNERTDTVPTGSAPTIPNSNVRIGQSTFFEPLKSEQLQNQQDSGVKICPKSDSIDSNGSDINRLLDEVLNKLGDDEK